MDKLTKNTVPAFIDRDGTINEEVCYLSSPKQLKLIQGSAEAIRELNKNGFMVIVITNQSGVARGILTEPLLADIHRRLQSLLAAEGAHFDAVYYCPHHPDGSVAKYTCVCNCRKPAAGMVYQAASEHNLTLPGSYVIGDKYIETRLARRIGAKGILVKTGHGEDEIKRYKTTGKRDPEFLAEDLLTAVKWLLNDVEHIDNA